jgi:hypothetical protein
MRRRPAERSTIQSRLRAATHLGRVCGELQAEGQLVEPPQERRFVDAARRKLPHGGRKALLSHALTRRESTDALVLFGEIDELEVEREPAHDALGLLGRESTKFLIERSVALPSRARLRPCANAFDSLVERLTFCSRNTSPKISPRRRTSS